MQTTDSKLTHYHLFYVRREVFSRFISGSEVPTLATFNETHLLVGCAHAYDLEHLFERMNLWQEDGLRRLFRRGFTHQSMSVGDVARESVWENGEIVAYKYWLCRPLGWEELV